MPLYPIFLKLEGHKVLIVGGGRIAEEKAEAVLRSATDVTVLAPQLTERLRLWAHKGLVQHVPEPYRPGLARGYFLVIAATDSAETNRAVYQEAKADGALSNAVDDPGYCDFYSPAVVHRGDFQIAVSTGGHSPALAQQVRKKLEREFGPEYGPWTAWLGRMRTALRSVLPPSERRKELLHLLALGRPQKTEGGADGRGQTERVGSQAETGFERASA
ncbi:MAG TPA: bifunctional precorrin-2 dehydrogenase/sirohydrochlorin ferrochelatase [Candidatus Angelobacter sp.]